MYERLFYENVLTELGESSEIIYLSVANAALAHLPYLVALDHQSRCTSLHKDSSGSRDTQSCFPCLTWASMSPPTLPPQVGGDCLERYHER